MRDAFVRLRRVYEFDAAFAVEKHRQLIEKEFSPQSVGAGLPYQLIYSTVGFGTAETVRRSWKQLKTWTVPRAGGKKPSQ